MLETKQVADALTHLRRLMGIHITWKTTTMWHALSGDFPENLYHHCNPYCMAVKKTRMKQCSYQESQGLNELADGYTGGAVVKTCHAGVQELVVPIILSGRIEGFLMVGPWRQLGAACPYDDLAELYAELPLMQESVKRQTGAILELVVKGLANMSMGRIAENPTDPRVRAAQAFIQSHFREAIQVADIATHCTISESRLIHLFSAQTGRSLSQYVIELRVEEAKHLLADPANSKANIALALGFCDQSHFSATFKKETGLTPGQYQTELNRQKETGP